MSKLGFEVTDNVAVLTLDNPPVNSFGLELRKLLVEAFSRIETDPGISAVIIRGSGGLFSGGADIREFGTPQSYAQPHLLNVLDAIEQCAKPVIAAIEGVCIGGGLEMSLACHYRVALPTAQVGLPEVKLGLLPGGGGTQRLPRVVGVETAVNMIVSGAMVTAEKLRGTQLFDRLADGELLPAARAFAREIIADKRGPKRVRDLTIDLPNAAALLQFARNSVKAVAGPYPAPLACVEAIANAVNEPFDVGMKHERELFAGLMFTPESAALRHIFSGRARGRPHRRHPCLHPPSHGQEGGRHRGGYHGRRHHHGVHQRRDTRGVGRSHPGGVGPRPGDHPSQLSGRASQRHVERGQPGEAPGAHHSHVELRAVRRRGPGDRGGVRGAWR